MGREGGGAGVGFQEGRWALPTGDGGDRVGGSGGCSGTKMSLPKNIKQRDGMGTLEY